MEKWKKGSCKYIFGIKYLWVFVLLFALTFSMSGYATETSSEMEVATVGNWVVATYSDEEREAYDESYLVKPVSAKSNKNPWGSSTLDKAYDDNWTSHWEADASSGSGTYVEYDFGKIEEIGQIIYRSRQDAGGKGFPSKFKIQVSDQESGDDFRDVAVGSASHTTEIIKITFDAVECRRLRFVWEEAYNQFPSASMLYCYREDLLGDKLQELFIDGAATALAEGVTQDVIDELQEEIDNYPVPGSMGKYIELAELLLSGKNETDEVHKPISLSQTGERQAEYNRTGLTMTLSSWDLTGYYARPGEVLDIFVDADPNGPMPRLVLAAIGRNWSWQYGYDGIVLGNGHNRITVPETMRGCQAIYFYNPSLPDEQEYAPVVRLCGGDKYPVYFYDSKDPLDVAEAKEEAFIKELQEYCTKVVNNLDKAASGEGEPNICEYVSDKILISTTAKGALKSIDSSFVWQKGQYLEWLSENTVKHAVVEQDENGQVTGIRYTGPAAVMEAWEMKFDDMQLYCGFNITDPTHEDYRNHGKFVYRAYTDGSGAGWGQNCYSGYNAGSGVDMESPMDDGWFSSLVTSNAPLQGSWTEYHELGHLFDSGLIGTSESTNNLFGLSAQRKYLNSTRMENDNRWYKHFTNYINTGVLPSNDLLFYPGAVIIQLDGVDFSGKSIYTEADISNYGRACRYARLHRDEISNLSKNDKLVVSFSIACGVDLSSHFEFYGREISAEAKLLLNGLPKEERPTWLVNDRTFKGGAFSQEDKEKVPVITSVVSDEKTGAVTIKIEADTFNEKNLQCFSIYRQRRNGDNLVGEVEWIGVTGDNLETQDVNELYEFTDVNVIPGYTYEYSVGVFDCKLIENENRAQFDVHIGEAVEVPLSRLLINNGDEGVTFDVGAVKKMQAVYAPVNATVDLNSIQWWVEGYGNDSGKTGGGKDIILLMDDPDYPGDPTRKLIKGIQPGQTHLKVKLGGITQQHRIVINGSLAVNDTNDVKYTFAFDNSRNTFKAGETYGLNLYRTTCGADGEPTSEVVRVATTPGGTSWESSAPEIISVDNRGNITAHASGEATISFKRGEEAVAQCSLTVAEETIALEQICFGKEMETLNVGDNLKLVYSLIPENTTQAETPVITSNNACVRVEKDGTITAVAGGEATVTVAIGGISANINITVNEYFPLKSIALSKESVTLTGKGSTETLSIVKTPLNASVSEEEALWTSGNESVFTVADGVVTAVGTGTADLKVSLGGKTTSIPITVKGVDILLTGIGFRGYSIEEDINLTLTAGKTHQLVLVTDPMDATGLGITEWSSSDNDVATVSYGYITAIAEGTTTITASLVQTKADGTEVEYTVECNLTVESADIPLEGVGISHKSVRLGGNETIQLSTKYMPTNANVDAEGNKLADMVWTSADSSIATVDSATGLVTGKKTGTTTITATGNGFSVTCQVVVNDSDLVEAISLDKESVTLNLDEEDETQLMCIIQPETITAAPLWKSSNPSIAEVDQNGKVTAYRVGTTEITATLGDKSASCAVTIVGTTYTVTFDSAGGEEIPAQVITKGMEASNPGDPTKENYKFIGWYLPNADVAYNFKTEVVTGDITLTAKWQVEPPTASIADGSYVEKNTEVVLSSVTGGEIYYTLDGTTPTKESTKYGAPILLTEDTTIKVFVSEEGSMDSEVMSYSYYVGRLSVSFDFNDGTGSIEIQKVKEGHTATQPAEPTREGFKFIGWYLEDADTPYDFATEVTNDITLYAKWEVNLALEDDVVVTAMWNKSGVYTKAPAENLNKIVDGRYNNFNDFSKIGEEGENPTSSSYIQIDLGEVNEITSFKLFRYWHDKRKFYATVIVVSEDPDFEEKTILYNSDTENKHGLEVGTDTIYNEQESGKEFIVKDDQDNPTTIKARYVRVYMYGSTSNTANYIVELQIWGYKLSPINFEALNAAIANAETKVKDNYTEESFNTMTVALEEAKALLDATANEQDRVNAAAEKLNTAVEELVLCVQPLQLSAASLSLYNDITVNYKANADVYEAYEDVKLEVVFRGETKNITECYEKGGKYIFVFDNVAPQLMNEDMEVTLYATRNGEKFESDPVNYSIAEYCYNILAKYPNNEKLRTLVVDLLNYGSAAQTYMAKGEENVILANATLTDEQKTWATNTMPSISSVTNTEYQVNENATVTWKAGTLLLNDAVTVVYEIEATDSSDLQMEVKADGATWYIKDFEAVDDAENRYRVYVNELNATQMSSRIETKIMNSQGEAVSNTMSYSVESYVKDLEDMEEKPSTELQNLVNQMIMYGYSAANYVKN